MNNLKLLIEAQKTLTTAKVASGYSIIKIEYYDYIM